MNKPITKNALVELGMDALDRDRVGQVSVSAVAGGVAFASALEVMEFAKLMAIADKAVPQHLRNNPGMCLAVTFQAVEWRMSPFQVANKSYVVNDRLAFESQLVHAVIEARAPLKERLNCTYEGEAQTLRCIITGTFRDGTAREYRSPELGTIKVQNSPLWKADPDQQLFYYSSRAWARRWCPDVLLGIYTKDEIEAYPELGRDEGGTAPGLHARLVGSAKDPAAEGFREGGTASELSQIAADSPKQEILAPEGQSTGKPADATDGTTTTGRPDGKPRRRLGRRKRGQEATGSTAPAQESTTEPAKAEEPARTTSLTNPDHVVSKDAAAKIADRAERKPELEQKPNLEPTTAADYVAYAERWIAAVESGDDASARWDGERDMRDGLSVPTKERIRLQTAILNRFPEE